MRLENLQTTRLREGGALLGTNVVKRLPPTACLRQTCGRWRVFDNGSRASIMQVRHGA